MNSVYTMTYDNATGSMQVGAFPFRVLRPPLELDHGQVLLAENKTDLNYMMCGNGNRRGSLCFRCRPGYGPAVLSYEQMCASCSDSHYGWLLYFLFACLPTIVFFLVIVFCQVRIASAPLNFFVLACQLISVSVCRKPQHWNTSHYRYLKGANITAGILFTVFS